MIRFRRRGLALMGTAVLTAGMLGVAPAATASARPSVVKGLAAATGTPFAQAQFAGYATGSELHLGALTLGTTTLAAVEQAFSGASANSGGLSTGINSVVQPPAIVQPPLSSAVNTYGRGSGLEVGLGTTPAVANQLKLGIAESSAPPTKAPVVRTVIPINLPGILTAGVLKGIAATAYNNSFCPVGQPLAFGEGDAAGVGLLGTSPPLVSTTGVSGTQDAQSRSRTDLVANADGTFGIASQTQQIIAPISVNLGATVSLQITVQGTGINSPVTLVASTDGEGHTGFRVVNGEAQVVITLVVAGVPTNLLSLSLNQILGQGGLVIDTATLPVLGPVLTALGINLHLAVAAPPHALATSGANSVAAAFDLVALHLGLTGGIQVANLNVGHMEAGVALPNGPIACTIPVSKNANPATVTAGNSFTWNINIPSSASALDASACDLTNLAATDVVGVSSGSPTFSITGISNGGTFNAATHTITWTNLGTYHRGDPPIVLTVTVNVPLSSGAGVLQDTANVTGGLGNCAGGITGQASLIGANVTNAILTGSITLVAPTVGAAGNTPLAATGTGPMLPWIAVGLLVVAEGTRRLVRRTRRPELT